MTVQEIITEITYIQRKFPIQAVAEAVRQREEITPELLRIIEDAIIKFEEIAYDSKYIRHIIAIYLLAQFREKRAYPIIVNLVSAEWELVDMALGDVITEGLGRILASVCDGDIDLICAMIENEKLNEYVRSAGLDALVTLVAQGVKTREEIMAYFLSLFQGKLERELSNVWNGLISCCCDIYPIEAITEIYRAYDDNLIDEYYIRPENVERYLKTDKTEKLRQLVKDPHYIFISDTSNELSRWLCLQEPEKPMKSSDRKDDTWTPAPPRSEIKVGRNDPCPCGSGKKYKKCCLQ